MNVLIVEDEPIPAEYLKSIIEKVEGFKVVAIAEDEDSILDAVHSYSIDIVFMDIMIKGSLSGAEIALKLSDLKPNILIIFLTAYSEEEMIEYATEANAFAYLLKPYRPNEIKATLALAKKRLRNRVDNSIKKEDNIVYLDKNYRFDLSTNKLFLENSEIKLTPKERDFILLLIKNISSYIDSKDIEERLDISDISLRSLLYRLRNKTHKDFILSLKGVGYKVAT